MQIARNELDTNPGSSDWFTGDVYLDTITVPSGAWRTTRFTSSSYYEQPVFVPQSRHV